MAYDHDALSQAFVAKYDGSDGDWAGNSGPGSDPYYNLPYRAFLESFIRMNSISTIVDIGCGDWQFSRYLDLRGTDYLGLDVVPSVVESNRRRFGSASVRFGVMPADLDAVPGAHLLIMKDVLQHLPIDVIEDFRRTVFPKFNFCLLTNSFSKIEQDGSPKEQNGDVPPGGFRCLDLRMAPFQMSGTYVLKFNIGVNEELRTLLVTR